MHICKTSNFDIMPLLSFGQVVHQSKNHSNKSETENCLALDNFQDQLLSRNWIVAMSLLQRHQVIAERANTLNELPLHTALWIDAPEEIVFFILTKCEDAVFRTNIKEQFPLHVAVKYCSSLKVIETLIKKYPYALEEKDDMNMTPRDYGRCHGEKMNNLLRLPISFWIA